MFLAVNAKIDEYFQDLLLFITCSHSTGNLLEQSVRAHSAKQTDLTIDRLILSISSSCYFSLFTSLLKHLMKI